MSKLFSLFAPEDGGIQPSHSSTAYSGNSQFLVPVAEDDKKKRMGQSEKNTPPQYQEEAEAHLPGYEDGTTNEDAVPIYMEKEVKNIDDFILPE